jgi:hypothetical protein
LDGLDIARSRELQGTPWWDYQLIVRNGELMTPAPTLHGLKPNTSG